MIKVYECVGMKYHMDTIEEMKEPSEDYQLSKSKIEEEFGDEHVYKYDYNGFITVEPEPDNEADPNAVRLSVGGKTVAYIKREQAAEVKELLASGTRYGAVISGGEYKAVVDDEVIQGEDPIKATVVFYPSEPEPKKKGLKVTLTILSILLLVMGLLALIVSPVVGVLAIIFAVALFLYGRKQ